MGKVKRKSPQRSTETERYVTSVCAEAASLRPQSYDDEWGQLYEKLAKKPWLRPKPSAEGLCAELLSQAKVFLLDYIDNKLDPEELKSTKMSLVRKYVEVATLIETQGCSDCDNVSAMLQKLKLVFSMLP